MIDTPADVAGWADWIAGNNHIDAKLRDENRASEKDYFLAVHAATEAMFRRILFVGLRLNRVTFPDASDWLFHNDVTPNKTNYPKLFDKLYSHKQITWAGVISSADGLETLWELWLGFSKTVRNHLAHGIRKYDSEWIRCGIAVDQELLIRLNVALLPFVGGSVAGTLSSFNPRLPKGISGTDLPAVTGIKSSNQRPKISLVDAQQKFSTLPQRKIASVKKDKR